MSTSLELGASYLLRYERDIQWIPPLIKPPAAEILDDAFQRSTTHVIDAIPHSLAFPIVGDNHF